MDVIRLVASDLDATLLDDQSQLPPDFAETVRALAERGIRFAAASGRPIYTLEEMFAPLQDDIILVGDNGGAICWKGESLYLSEMDVADWHTLAGQARSVWPANIRPSVAVEILQGRVPARTITGFLQVPIRVQGATIRPQRYESQATLYADVTQELTDPRLAVEYLAANLERGIYRAEYEHVQVTWRTLAAWHNQGLVSPAEAHANATSADYLRRITSYLPAARALIAGETCSGPQCTESGIWPE